MKKTLLAKALILVLAVVFVLCFVVTGSVSSAFAAEDYAAVKGFTVSDNLDYIADLNTERQEVADYGNISLWSSRYTIWDRENDIFYIVVLAEARISSVGNGKVNEKMTISISHEGETCNLLDVSPKQKGGTVTVQSGINFGVSPKGPEFSFSYGQSNSYSEIDYKYSEVAEYKDENNYDYINEVVFEVDFSGYAASGNADRSPYAGTIVQKMSVVYSIENFSDTSFDTDYDKTIVEYTGRLHKQGFLWWADSQEKTIKHTICDRNQNVSVNSIDGNETYRHDVQTYVEIY